MARILCFGDSITFGYTDPEGGWVQRLHNRLGYIDVTAENNPVHEVINLGISADTADDVLKRMTVERDARIQNESDLILIAVGTNDSVYSQSSDDTYTTPEEFSNKLTQLVELAREKTQNVALIGLLPCEESKMQPMPWSTSGKCYSNKRLAMFNKAIEHVASEMEVEFFDMYVDMLGREYEKYLHDGLHPNSVGHQYITDKIFKWVQDKANTSRR